jgi:hypothetical protein
VAAFTPLLGDDVPACAPTPVEARAVADLDAFTGWLRENGARGYVGEVGWPAGKDAAAWNDVASAWFEHADAKQLWVTVWAAGRWWPASYRMAVFRLTGRQGSQPVPGPQAAVVRRHLEQPAALRGLALPSGAFGAGHDGPATYSNTSPGRLGRDYYYEDATDYRQIHRLGADLVRLSFTWERLQPVPGGPLDNRELGRLARSVRAAHAAGLETVLDLHNYGDYYVSDGLGGHRRLVLGTSELPIAVFVDVWRRISRAMQDLPGVLGYGLMNEPTALAPSDTEGADIWERASQQATTAIRSTGDHHTVMVSGYGGSSPGQWRRLHPRAWVKDPDNAVRYEIHQYFDAARSGAYPMTFRQETGAALRAGYGGAACASSVRPS